MSKISGFTLVVTFMALILSTGCSSGSLDRTSAKKAIQARFNDDISGIILHIGRVGPKCFNTGYPKGEQIPVDLTPDKSLETAVAILAGYVTVRPDGQDYWRVDLTEKGKAAPKMDRLKLGDDHNMANGCDHRTTAFSVASMEVVQVTGISSDQEKGADVRMAEFEWRWKATDLGEMLRENGSVYSKLTPEQRDKLIAVNPTDGGILKVPVPPENDIRQAMLPFKKYDDGWRLQAPPKASDQR